jgi:hypothetical protein
MMRDRMPQLRLPAAFGLKGFVHEQNRDYGANQKTCYREALELAPTSS